MPDSDPLRAAHEAEQREAQNELQTEAEFNDWLRNWKQRDAEADLAFNHARTLHTLAIVSHFNSKAALNNALALLMLVLAAVGLVIAIVLGVEAVR